jgi:hypothetical protein
MMSYPIRTTYNGFTILEHDPANSGQRFQIEYSPGNFGGLCNTLEEAKQTIDYQLAMATRDRENGGGY